MAGETILALVRSESQAAKAAKLGARAVIGDITRPDTLAKALTGVEKIVHLAAVNRDKGEITMEKVNALGTIHLVDAAKAAGVKHIVTVVGLGADSKRPYPLAATQGRGVEYLMASGVPYTVLEASVIFGAGDEFLNTFAGLAKVPPVMVVPGDGRSRFQPIAAQDVAACAAKALIMPEVINRRLQICGSEVITLEGIIDAILSEMRLSRIKLHMPVPILRIAVGLMDALPKPPVTKSLLAQLGVDNVATDNATEKVFGVKPIKLREGISFVREMTLSKLISRSLGRLEYR
jgi:NADH dehydrogenase